MYVKRDTGSPIPVTGSSNGSDIVITAAAVTTSNIYNMMKM